MWQRVTNIIMNVSCICWFDEGHLQYLWTTKIFRVKDMKVLLIKSYKILTLCSFQLKSQQCKCFSRDNKKFLEITFPQFDIFCDVYYFTSLLGKKVPEVNILAVTLPTMSQFICKFNPLLFFHFVMLQLHFKFYFLTHQSTHNTKWNIYFLNFLQMY